VDTFVNKAFKMEFQFFVFLFRFFVFCKGGKLCFLNSNLQKCIHTKGIASTHQTLQFEGNQNGFKNSLLFPKKLHPEFGSILANRPPILSLQDGGTVTRAPTGAPVGAITATRPLQCGWHIIQSGCWLPPTPPFSSRSTLLF
jgi:hypothetical protein